MALYCFCVAINSFVSESFCSQLLAGMWNIRLAQLLYIFSLLHFYYADNTFVHHPNISSTAVADCRHTADCPVGNYCNGRGKCACLHTHVQVDSYCWRKIKPGDIGCTIDQQCEAAWAGATCQSGVCQCAKGEYIFRTRDGNVCIDKKGGKCPLNDNYPAFRIKHKIQRCSDDSSCVAIGAFAYDCIGINRNSSIMQRNGICCPSKAMACIQEPDEGVYDGNDHFVYRRWYYVPSRQQCIPLNYKGRGGNANNFVTKEHCETYCLPVCKRGPPLYRKSRAVDSGFEPIRCSNSTFWDNNYQCEKPAEIIETNLVAPPDQYYCPSTDFICSQNGGIHTNMYKKAKLSNLHSEPFDVGVPSGVGGKELYHRFYYDTKLGRCVQFPYLGQGGNFNNFLTRKQCEDFCMKPMCSRGEPLKNRDDQIIQCSATSKSPLLSDQPESALSADCPSTHRCEVPNAVRKIEKGVCCPRPQFVCNTPPNQSLTSECDASVTQNVTRWWFNSGKGKCVKYSHPDCESVLDNRSNSFVSERKCQEYCRNAKVCPSPFVPLPDDGVAPYRFCDPMANSSDFVRSCNGGQNARCQYSKYLKHHVCCVKDSAKSLTNRFISQMQLMTEVPANSVSDIKNWRRGSYASSNGSTRCCKFHKKSDTVDKHHSIQPALAIDLKVVIVLFWLSGVSLALFTGICCCVIAKRYWAALIIPLSNSLTINKENDNPSKVNPDESLSTETTCVYNPYSECPVEFKRKSEGKF